MVKLSLAVLALALSATVASAAPARKAKDLFTTSGNCSGQGAKYIVGQRPGYPDIKPALNAIATAAGKKLEVYSCFRSQERQNQLLRQRGCAPFGSKNCSSTTARVSQHTRSVAADFKNITRDLKKQCQFIAKGREKTGGLGGVGTYPKGDGHFDVGSTRSWNRCKGVVGGSQGYKSRKVAKWKKDRMSRRASR